MYKSNDYRYYQQFSDSIKNLALVTSEKDLKALKRFKDFFESLVAYHKFYNTLNNQRR
jgi:CRISPR-associated protein Csm2